MELIRETPNKSKVYVYSDTIILKEFNSKFFNVSFGQTESDHNRWITLYNDFYDRYNMIPKLIEFDPKNFKVYMEKIEGMTCAGLFPIGHFPIQFNQDDLFNMYHKYGEFYFRLWSYFYKFSLDKQIGFYHSDMNSSNIMITVNDEFKLVDIENLVVSKYVNISTLFNHAAPAFGKLAKACILKYGE